MVSYVMRTSPTIIRWTMTHDIMDSKMRRRLSRKTLSPVLRTEYSRVPIPQTISHLLHASESIKMVPNFSFLAGITSYLTWREFDDVQSSTRTLSDLQSYRLIIPKVRTCWGGGVRECIYGVQYYKISHRDLPIFLQKLPISGIVFQKFVHQSIFLLV